MTALLFDAGHVRFKRLLANMQIYTRNKIGPWSCQCPSNMTSPTANWSTGFPPSKNIGHWQPAAVFQSTHVVVETIGRPQLGRMQIRLGILSGNSGVRRDGVPWICRLRHPNHALELNTSQTTPTVPPRPGGPPLSNMLAHFVINAKAIRKRASLQVTCTTK